ncbi:hypothetical protein HPP92_008908 [Vanilla planifolia]|uniref:C2 NT-type domain-containing protein n=1 Tax=Vanilla planifolia TaxID=51239 RepID=A0A835RI88_VANPL|nr:hypothetical protein HPP92_008908 [Vanilla planifolia]
MVERPPSGKRHPTSSEDALLLKEIESLNRALSADPKHHRIRPADPKPQTASSSSSRKEKKPSFWNWKPLKALSHIGQRRFDCVFSFHVHSIENIPEALADASLSIQWRRNSDPPSAAAGTTSVKVFNGVAEFEETLTYRCSVYGARPSSNHSAAKYEARRFIIYASVCNSPGMDLGKHLVDLTRLLPLTLEELNDEGSSSGKWSTSFRLTGEGRGACLSVSFGFSLIRDGALGSSSENRVFDVLNLKMVDEGSVGRGRNKGRRWGRSQSVEDVKVLHELLPTSKSHASSLSDSVENMELKIGQDMEPCDLEASLKTDVQMEDEFSERKPSTLLENVEGSYQNQLEEPEFNVIEQGVEIAANDQLCAPIFDKIDLEEDDQLKGAPQVDEESAGFSSDSKECASLHEGNPLKRECQGMTTHSLLFSEPLDVEMLHSVTKTSNQTSQIEVKSEHRQGDLENDHFSFDTSDAIATEFLNMLSVEHIPVVVSSDSDPDSPRERLWKQFEKETLGAGSVLFGLDMEMELDDGKRKKDDMSEEDSEDFVFSPMVPEVEREILDTTHVLSHSSTAELLEVAESEALMKKWGLNENTFHCSLPGSRSSVVNPTDLSMEVSLKLPPLGEGLGSFVRTKDGGFLRSMSPSLFKNAKNNASLIMQVSSPVVVPAELGSSIMEILQRLASVGIEKLSVQAQKLMPIEDVAGKTIQQIAFEASSPLDDCKRMDILLPLSRHASASISEKVSGSRNKPEALHCSSCSTYEIDSGYVSIDDLAPSAMDKIETLSMEGLKIQSGMSIVEAPSNICSHCFGNISVLEENGSNKGRLTAFEGTEGLHLIDVRDKEDDIDELLSLSITLDEWVRLDSGMVDDEVQTSDRTSKILAAHSSSLSNLITGGWKQEAMGGKSSGRKWGLLGSNFTAALMVQLRDPLRNYDPVGTPMLGLIQVERDFVPPKVKVCTNISVKRNNDEDDEPERELKSEPVVNGKEGEDAIPRFKITGVHVAGLKTEPNKKKFWGKPMQQQSGSRWLLASGMGKSNKHPFMKSKFVSEPSLGTTAVSPGDVLWSISSFVRGTGSRLKEQLVNSHIRNPNVIFPKPTVSLHSAD